MNTNLKAKNHLLLPIQKVTNLHRAMKATLLAPVEKGKKRDAVADILHLLNPHLLVRGKITQLTSTRERENTILCKLMNQNLPIRKSRSIKESDNTSMIPCAMYSSDIKIIL